MYIPPSQSTYQAYGNSPNATGPVAQIKQPVAAEQSDSSAPNAILRADAAPPAEAPPRPEPDSRPPAPETVFQDRPGAKVNLLI